MADVRSLLRSEQASRRISHPHLTYTRSGQLLCTVCGGLAIKSASLWEGHLRSPNHRKNVQKAAETLSTANQAKKRKNDDGEEDESRKRRAMSEDVEEPLKEAETTTTVDRPKKKAKSVTFAEDTLVRSTSPEQDLAKPITVIQEISKQVVASARPAAAATAAVDEDEWAAFEREVEPLAKDTPINPQYSATIVAAPVLTTRPPEPEPEQETRKPSKEVEAEEEKEDDERRLEEELDVMEEMEERVRRLKQKRESLRKSPMDTDPPGQIPEAAAETGDLPDPTTNGDVMAVEVDGESDDDDYDDYDDWGFR